MIDTITQLHTTIRHQSPLVHCLTNHITINDCANVILAVGGKPIMAEHPKEVTEITGIAGALYVNLGNITDTRMSSMNLSGAAANHHQVPIVLDLVGVGCSSMRLEFAKKFIQAAHPQVLKGNISEVKALLGDTNAQGIDAGAIDLVTEENLIASAKWIQSIALAYDCVVVATGKIDLIASPTEVYALKNGCATLSLVTGTGCMVGAIISTYIASGGALESAILGTALMGIAGELHQDIKGTGSFRIALMDTFSTITPETIQEIIQLERIETL